MGFAAPLLFALSFVANDVQRTDDFTVTLHTPSDAQQYAMKSPIAFSGQVKFNKSAAPSPDHVNVLIELLYIKQGRILIANSGFGKAHATEDSKILALNGELEPLTADVNGHLVFRVTAFDYTNPERILKASDSALIELVPTETQR